jgi:hypothetical protein
MGIQADVANIVASTQNLIVEKFGTVYGWVGAIQSNMSSFFTSLQGMVEATPTSPGVFIPDIDAEGTFVTVNPVDFPVEPTFGNPPSEPAEVTLGEAPSIPSYTLPSEPTLTPISVPDIPSLSIPVFSKSVPSFNEVVPSVSINEGQTNFDTILLDTILDKLLVDIRDGGTGIPASVEDAIWQRGTEREEIAVADAAEKLAQQWAKRGFSLPSGALAEGLNSLYTDYENRRIDKSREIESKQADLEQKNMTERITQAIQIESRLMDFVSECGRRVLEASKAVADAAMEAFKAQILKYNSDVEAYRSESEAYKNIIQGELLKVEVYKGQLEGVKMILGIDELSVKLYSEKISTIKVIADIYEAEVRGYAERLRAESERIRAYQSKVEAYVAQCNALTQVYAAKIQGKKAYYDTIIGAGQVNAEIIANKVRAMSAEAQVIIEGIKNQTNYNAQMTNFRRAGAGHLAQAAAQFVVGALTSIATHAHINAQGSASENYNENYTQSV